MWKQWTLYGTYWNYLRTSTHWGWAQLAKTVPQQAISPLCRLWCPMYQEEKVILVLHSSRKLNLWFNHFLPKASITHLPSHLTSKLHKQGQQSEVNLKLLFFATNLFNWGDMKGHAHQKPYKIKGYGRTETTNHLDVQESVYYLTVHTGQTTIARKKYSWLIQYSIFQT